MKLPVFLLLATAPLALLPATAHAVELWGTGPLSSSSMQVSSDLEVRYHHVPDKLAGFEDRNIHDYVEQVERLNLLLSKDHLVVGAQVDQVALIANKYILDGELYHSWPLYEDGVISPFDDGLVRLEKRWVQNQWGALELTVGDTYASFGRGMALNMVKNTDIDLDSSLRGAKVVLRGDTVEFTGVTGLSNTQDISQDNPNMGINIDPRHMVTGGRVDLFGLGPINLGIHGVAYRFGRTEDAGEAAAVRYTEDLDAVVSGASAELGLAGLDVYIEGDLYGYAAEDLGAIDGDPVRGYAGYASVGAYPGRTTLLLEAKRTVDTEVLNAFVSAEGWEVASVPTLEYERVITEDASAAINSDDLMGARLRVDRGSESGQFTPYIAVAAFQDDDIGGLHFNRTPETIGHGVAGVQWFAGAVVLQGNAGYRMDMREDASEGADRLAHVDAELHLPVGTDGVELAVDVKRFQWGVNPLQQEDFLEMANAIGWHRGEKWMFLFYQDWTNNPLVTSEGNIGDDLYGAVEVTWHRTPSSTIRAFYGAYKAGIRCSGGQCRTLPGFEGGRVSWQATF